MILVAPDKFKGSATAREVAAALGRGLRSALPHASIVELPTADGGEGTVEMLEAHGFARKTIQVAGPLGTPVRGTYAHHGTTAVIEMATAAGIAQLGRPVSPQTAMQASTRGVGELIADAIDAGCTRLVVTAGGSASSDGGSGALCALGLQFLTEDGEPVSSGGRGLLEASRVQTERLDPRLADLEIVVVTDVDSPLTGPLGAAQMFGPQKGASPTEVATLDRALRRWADLVSASVGMDLRELPGAGAAGGFAFGLASLLGAEVVSDSTFLLELIDFFDVARRADLVIVGEGSLDRQSLRGKGPVRIAQTLRSLGGPPVVAVAGRCELDPDQLRAVGIQRSYDLRHLAPDQDASMARAKDLLEHIGYTIGTTGIGR